MDELRRVCERAAGGRRAAAPLFWLVGGNQVGKAAISGWRDVLLPVVRAGIQIGLWPFDGDLESLVARHDVVVTETHPTEFYRHLDAHPDPGKRTQAGRRPACVAMATRADAIGVALSDEAHAALDDAFGDHSTAEDRFDAFVGLIGMLNVLSGRRPAGPPPNLPGEVTAVEGWILGQSDAAPTTPTLTAEPSLQRLASLISRRNAIDDHIAALIGRPALPGHIGEYIAAQVFDIDLAASATQAGFDGVFRSGPLAGATVNIKLYGKRDGSLDIPSAVPDYFLVLTGPVSAATSSVGGTRPVAIDEVFLFHGPDLVRRLRERGVKVVIATSVRREDWDAARVWPYRSSGRLDLATPEALKRLEPFRSIR